MPDSARPADGSLAQLPLFAGLPPDVHDAIVKDARVRSLATGDVLVRQGDASGPLFVVLEGSLEVLATSPEGRAQRVGTVGVGETVGEMALLFDSRRAATVQALEASSVLEIDAGSVRAAFRAHGPLRERLWSLLIDRLPRLRATALDLLQDLPPPAVDALRAELEWVRVPGGEHLYRAGEPGTALYVVGSGRLRVVGASNGLVADDDLGPGAVVGDSALFRDGPRAESIRAVRDSEAVRLDRAGFERAVRRHPEIARAFMRAIVERAERSTLEGQRRPTSVATVAVLGLTRGASVDVFAERLADAFRVVGSTALLDARRVDAALGPGTARCALDDARAGWVTEWLAQQERHHMHLVLVASDRPDQWTDRCLRQADHLLVLAEGASGLIDERHDELLTRMARERGDGVPTTELVRLDPDLADTETPTAGWLEGRLFAGHHHVPLADAASYGRLVRRLTGRAVGLALGGGGARGIAHLGLLSALAEAGVPVDMVAGTSIGALVASVYAMHRDVDRTAEILRAGLVDAGPTRTPALLPLVSLLSDGRIETELQRALRDRQIEDLSIPFACVASNLTRAEPRIFRRGPLWRAVRASISLPGVLPPVLEGGDVLVDGGIVDNLPVDLLRARCGIVVASTVHGNAETTADPELARVPSASSLLWSRACGSMVRVPSLSQVLASTITCAGQRRAEFQLAQADFVFAPPVGSFGILEFPRFEEIYDVGRRYADEVLAELTTAIAHRLAASPGAPRASDGLP